jgi:hypothetical protein
MARLFKIAILQPSEEQNAKIEEIRRECHYSDDVRCFGQYDDDGERATMVFTNDPLTIRFLDELMASCIKWRVYSGRYMHGEETVGVVCGFSISEDEVIHSTSVDLARDFLGTGTILYLKPH